MNKFKSLLITSTLIAGTVTSFAQTAEQIIAKHIEAIGGNASWKKVNSIKYTGNLSAQGMSIPISQTIVNGKAMRMEFTVMGVVNYTILTEKEGWMYMPVQGQQEPTPLSEEDVKASQYQLDIPGELFDYEKKGNKIALAGKEKINDKDVFKLTLTDKDGKEKTLYFDATSYYLVREQEKVNVQGQEMDATTNYSDYKKLPEGIVVAMAIESADGPMSFSSVEVNPTLDEAIFKPGK